MPGDNTAPYCTSVTSPFAFLRSRLTTTISRATRRSTSAVKQAEPTAPAPLIPIFMPLLAFTPQRPITDRVPRGRGGHRDGARSSRCVARVLLCVLILILFRFGFRPCSLRLFYVFSYFCFFLLFLYFI